MRFDDTLRTVLAADMSTPFGAAAAWRQLVDLIGRGPSTVDPAVLDRLADLRGRIPQSVRIASARGLSAAVPPRALLELFLGDSDAVAAPLLREGRVVADDWIALLPRMSPYHRSLLRARRDLPDPVVRALASLGAGDMVLADERQATDHSEPLPAEPLPTDPVVGQEPAPAAEPVVLEPEIVPTGPFRIADVVARIDAHRDGGAGRIERRSRRRTLHDVSAFRFETDASGLIRWVDGTDRAPLIGLSLARPSALSQTDGVVGGAFRQRATFRDARLEIGGISPVAGAWRISGVPVFDPRTGRFTGYRGNARRPRAEDSAHGPAIGADSLRQLVHELRTPANAIAGFAEMIDTQLLGPVPDVYRGYAGVIRRNIGDLLGAIDDLDIAARIEASALSLSPGHVGVRGLVERIVGDLGGLAAQRGAHILIEPGDAVVRADSRALERLVARLVATVVGAAVRDDEIGIMIDPSASDSGGKAEIAIDLPAMLRGRTLDSLCAIEDELADDTLLGTGFAFRLIANLARELGGSMAVSSDCLTVTLPTADDGAMDRSSTDQR